MPAWLVWWEASSGLQTAGFLYPHRVEGTRELSQWVFKNYCIHPSVYVVVSWFWYAFLLWLIALSIFYVLIDHLYNFFQEISLQILCPFLNWVCLFIVDLYKLFIFLGTKPLTDIWYSDIFSHAVSCVFTFLVVSFEGQMFLTDEVQSVYDFCFSCFCFHV